MPFILGIFRPFETFIESEFGVCEKEKMFNGEKNNVTIALTYYPDLNEYMGVESIQIVVTGYVGFCGNNRLWTNIRA